ncbi:MAG TPA: MarR family transcriptional regulator [Steroidobacteraceae bacterium]|nr:MarR family transcriptional regulator [Steroidobacteraceae bacterium]HRX89711.1 MarR family transcriptional regulator [Steroidobacteraceae bacterium]
MTAAVDSSSDLETRATEAHHESLRLWLRLLTCTNLIETSIRQRLQSRFGTTLPRFDLLAQLERAPDGLKMGELSRRMMVTGGNVTGITDALEAEGLVTRLADSADRRALRVKLTAEGRRLFQRMASEHEKWVIELFAGIGARDKARLGELLGQLKQHAAQSNNQP